MASMLKPRTARTVWRRRGSGCDSSSLRRRPHSFSESRRSASSVLQEVLHRGIDLRAQTQIGCRGGFRLDRSVPRLGALRVEARDLPLLLAA